MEDDRIREIAGSVAARQNQRERVVFLTHLEWRAPAQPLIEDFLASTGPPTKCHIAGQGQSSEGGNFKPFGIFVGEE